MTTFVVSVPHTLALAATTQHLRLPPVVQASRAEAAATGARSRTFRSLRLLHRRYQRYPLLCSYVMSWAGSVRESRASRPVCCARASGHIRGLPRHRVMHGATA